MIGAFGQFRRGFAAECFGHAKAAVFIHAEQVVRNLAALFEIEAGLQDVDGGEGAVDMRGRIAAIRFGGGEDAERAFQFAQGDKDDAMRAFDGKRLARVGAAVLGAGVKKAHVVVLSVVRIAWRGWVRPCRFKRRDGGDI